MIKINTFLRPAVVKDVFDKNGLGNIIEEKQFYYKEKYGSIYGPHRLCEPFKENATHFYLNIFELLNEERIFVVDPLEYSESIAVALPLKKVEEFDILQGNQLIEHTMFYLKTSFSVDGPFYINAKTTKKDLKNKASNKLLLVLDKPRKIKVLESHVKLVG